MWGINKVVTDLNKTSPIQERSFRKIVACIDLPKSVHFFPATCGRNNYQSLKKKKHLFFLIIPFVKYAFKKKFWITNNNCSQAFVKTEVKYNISFNNNNKKSQL